MRVCLLSMFANATSFLDRYFDQMAELRGRLAVRGHVLHLLLVEGDSTDDTWLELSRRVRGGYWLARLWQHHHGQPLYRGTGHPERFKNLSRIWNEMLDAVPDVSDMAVIVESDLVWDADVLLELIMRSRADGNIHCPMVWLDGAFYDVMLYRRNGVLFTNHPPYHADLVMGQPLELDSAGSCLVMPGHIARAHRTTAEGELMGLCHSARAEGRKVILDSDLSIRQPESEWVGVQPFMGVA